MKLSISNIAWLKEDDNKVYEWMSELGYTGLEVAPTRIFSETPYEKNTQAYDLRSYAIGSMNSEQQKANSVR